MYNKLRLQNFTAFADAEFEFVGGVNAYVGTNGCGKTHVLKLLYGLQKHQFLVKDPERSETLSRTLRSLFQPESLKRLVKRPKPTVSTVSAVWAGKDLSFEIKAKQTGLDIEETWNVGKAPVFIPVTEILGHSMKFIQAYERGWVDFDVTYRDILLHATPVFSNDGIDEKLFPLLRELHTLIDGSIKQSKEGRYYVTGRRGPLAFPLVAEGHRKLGLLWTLISNGCLEDGNVLYWDEPEANLNPGTFPLVARFLAVLV